LQCLALELGHFEHVMQCVALLASTPAAGQASRHLVQCYLFYHDVSREQRARLSARVLREGREGENNEEEEEEEEEEEKEES